MFFDSYCKCARRVVRLAHACTIFMPIILSIFFSCLIIDYCVCPCYESASIAYSVHVGGVPVITNQVRMMKESLEVEKMKTKSKSLLVKLWTAMSINKQLFAVSISEL